MHWGRKVALLMLAAVILWTAMPVSACVLTMQSSARPACCDGMAKVAMSGMKVLPACCRIRATEPALTPISPFSPEQSLKPLLVAYPTSLERSIATHDGWRNAQETPPPRTSAGRISILRI
jgi:hypothetical protein